MKNYKGKIRQCLNNGKIIYDGTNVKFNDGHIIGGVMADTQEKLIDIIERCLRREDFSIPQCLK